MLTNINDHGDPDIPGTGEASSMSESNGPDQDDGPSDAIEGKAAPSDEGRVVSFDGDAHSPAVDDPLT